MRRNPLGPALWILILAVVLTGAAVVWRLGDALRTPGSRAVGDGRDPATYGFDLGNCLVPRAQIAATGLPRDGMPVLDLPPLAGVAVVDSLAGEGRKKYLVPGDRVIGVTLGGQARAYPLIVLNWHEIVNDTLGGVPITVTYSPLCDAVAVFDRRQAPPTPGEARDQPPAPDESRGGGNLPSGPGEVLEFGHSGLLYNSNLLMYDRGRPGQESLWCQLQARAIAGPAAARGDSLRLIPSQLVRWEDWKTLHPHTTVLARDPLRAQRYRREPYTSYYGSDLLRYPTAPLPGGDALALKTPCLILGYAGEWTVVPLPVIEARSAGSTRRCSVEAGGRSVPLVYHDRPPTVVIGGDTVVIGGDAGVIGGDAGDTGESSRELPHDLQIMHAFWFAWYATHPEAVALH